MRSFELALILVLLARVAWSLRRPSGPGGGPARWAPSTLTVAALAAHLALEGARWNLAGVYLLAVIWVLADVVAAVRRATARAAAGRPVARSRPGPLRRAAGAFFGVAILALASAPAVLLPVPRLPAPTGPFPVGTDAIEYAVPDGAERVRARIWYPAAPSARGAPPAPWLEHLDVMLPALGVRAGLPDWALTHLAHTRVYASWGVPLGGSGPLGVVTFDHGRGGFAAQNTFLAEDLASHGWLVVAPEHPGGAVLTVFRDGTRVPFDPDAFGEGLEGAAYQDAIRSLGRVWARETAAALDALAAGAGPDGLAARLDPNRWIATGHSTGGGAAYGLCADEPGCRAAVGLDPWMLPTPPELLDAGADGLSVRVVGLFSDPALGFFEPENLAAYRRLADAARQAGGQASEAIYPGAGHMDFADVGLLSPVADRLGLYVGPASPRTVLPRVRADVRSVLDEVDASSARVP